MQSSDTQRANIVLILMNIDGKKRKKVATKQILIQAHNRKAP